MFTYNKFLRLIVKPSSVVFQSTHTIRVIRWSPKILLIKYYLSLIIFTKCKKN